MKTRHFLLGIAAGLTAGYAAARALQAAQLLKGGKPETRTRDAAEYGALRRTLALGGIARSIAGSAALAYGPVGERLERSVRGLPLWVRPAAFVAEVSVLEAIAELPVDFVEGFAVERRYGLSDQSAASWLSDHAKQSALGGAVAAVLSGILAALLRKFPKSWPYVSSAGVFPLLLVANVVIPLYVLPLFNTYEPLTGPLEERLRRLAARYGVGDAEILRMNMSKQTKKANAFVIGIGNTHRIVVGDTLIEHFPDEEIEFVVAHELGHYVSRDTWRMIALGQVTAMIVLFGAFYADRSESGDALKLARLQLWATLLSQLMRPGMSAFARSREWAADRFALEGTRAPHAGASAFRRLRDQNLAEDEQPKWFEFMFSTHPSLKARIQALEAASQAETATTSHR
ncbi:MAG TPA: M48 family metallopeptidase [Candidatus Baltobacteraceae bacterium]|nr:M48 family metallopeptidase [Candidatus Baltobacteraceae bacterium]